MVIIRNYQRLEKDLIKTYIVQLYDAVTDDAEVSSEEDHEIKFVEHKMPKREERHKIEVPEAIESIMPKVEASKPFPEDPGFEAKKEKMIEPEMPVKETLWTSPPVESRSFPHHSPEVTNETLVQTPRTSHSSADMNEALNKLFDLPKMDELAGRTNHIPIATIESAMGLNDRIFILKELFGGDKTLFDVTCSKLNHLNSYAEARTMLMAGPAKDFNWADPKQLKMAEQFVRLVSRRYPKSVS